MHNEIHHYQSLSYSLDSILEHLSKFIESRNQDISAVLSLNPSEKGTVIFDFFGERFAIEATINPYKNHNVLKTYLFNRSEFIDNPKFLELPHMELQQTKKEYDVHTFFSADASKPNYQINRVSRAYFERLFALRSAMLNPQPQS